MIKTKALPIRSHQGQRELRPLLTIVKIEMKNGRKPNLSSRTTKIFMNMIYSSSTVANLGSLDWEKTFISICQSHSRSLSLELRRKSLIPDMNLAHSVQRRHSVRVFPVVERGKFTIESIARKSDVNTVQAKVL